MDCLCRGLLDSGDSRSAVISSPAYAERFESVCVITLINAAQIKKILWLSSTFSTLSHTVHLPSS